MNYFIRILFRDIPRLACTLSKSPRHHLGLGASLWWFVITRKLKLIQTKKKFSLYFNNSDFSFTLYRPMDIAVLREIYLDKEYDWCPIENPKVIIDLGAHIGDTTMYYHICFPGAQIIAVEPSPKNYERLLVNTGTVSVIKPIQAAVGCSEGIVMLYEGVSALGFSTIASSNKDGIEVQQHTLKSLLKCQAVDKADLIKFDIEGAEFELFRGINPAEFSKAYIGELHFDLSDTTKEEFANLFADFKTEWIEVRPGRYMFRAYQ